MRILICEKPGLFRYQDADRPGSREGHLLLRVHRVGICGTDLHAFEGTQPYFEYPRILGHELGCSVEDPNGSLAFRKGDHVTIIPYFNCGSCIACRNGLPNCCASLRVFGVHTDGGMREYISVPESALVHGGDMSFDELALIEPLSIGAHGIRRAGVKPGEFVLVVGAGPIGLGLMEFARIAGAQVIALDINDNRLDFCVHRLRVQHAIHGSKEDVLHKLHDITQGDMPTVVIDATGSQRAIHEGFQYLAHGGRYVLVGLQKGDIVASHPAFHKREATLMSSRNAIRDDFDHVMRSMRAGLVDPSAYITDRVGFGDIAGRFPYLLDPANGVIKAMVEC